MYPSPKLGVTKNLPPPPPPVYPTGPDFYPPTLPLHRMLNSDCEIAFNTFLWIDKRLRVVVFFLICVINVLLELNNSN